MSLGELRKVESAVRASGMDMDAFRAMGARRQKAWIENEMPAVVEQQKLAALDRQRRTFIATVREVGHNDEGHLTFKLEPWQKDRPAISVTMDPAARPDLVKLRNGRQMQVILGKDGASFESLMPY